MSVSALLFFFKQKTAYEMRISDWSSDVFSSDRGPGRRPALRHQRRAGPQPRRPAPADLRAAGDREARPLDRRIRVAGRALRADQHDPAGVRWKERRVWKEWLSEWRCRLSA